MMNEVIDKLLEIEAVAVRIVDNANTQKEETTKKLERDILSFDKKLDQNTESKINLMKENLEIEIQKELDLLHSETKKNLQDLQLEYAQNHSILATGILNILTGV